MIKKFLLLVILLLSKNLCLDLFCQIELTVSSPDKQIVFTLTSPDQRMEYSIQFQNKNLIDHSPIHLYSTKGVLGEHVKIESLPGHLIQDSYDLIVGKANHVSYQCNQKIYHITDLFDSTLAADIETRVFNDGLAFRYYYPKSNNTDSLYLLDENTGFNVVGDPKVLAMYLPSFQTSHEGLYTYTEYKKLDNSHLMEMPVLFQYAQNVYMSILEANVRDFAGAYLWKENEMLMTKLSPRIDKPNLKIISSLPHYSPWRVIQIGNKPGSLIESNILTNLNEACKLDDVSWIKPGKTTFTWWNGNMVPDTNFAPGNNFETNKYYIDFAAAHHIQYHAIYGYAEQPWYEDDGFDFGTPGQHVDITKPIKPLDIKKICEYGKNKGVDVYVWVNWKALYSKLDSALATFEAWGLCGTMVDFMDRDDQEMINIQEEILLKSAKHHLFVQFHGSSKPSGLHRTYPNEFTREGTLNYEVYKWGNSNVNADHDIHIPFTRMLAGPTDYHLGGFRAVSRKNYKEHYTHPNVLSTRCHMMAMYVVLESYLSMVADVPEAYIHQPGFEFVQAVPSTWDETSVLNASVTEYITIARRKANHWYIGSINNHIAREIDIKLDFLDDKTHQAILFTDAMDVDKNPNHLIRQTRLVSNKDILHLKLGADGGVAMIIK